MLNLPAWLTTSTTGQGGSVLLGLVAGLSTGTLTWQHAIPIAVLGVALILFPQNPGLAQAAQTVATDAVAAAPVALADYRQIALAFQAGIQHAAVALPAPAPVAIAAPVPAPVPVSVPNPGA